MIDNGGCRQVQIDYNHLNKFEVINKTALTFKLTLLH